MSNEISELSKIKEIKIIFVDVIESSQNKINQFIKDGWVIVAIEKNVGEDLNESVYYHLGRL